MKTDLFDQFILIADDHHGQYMAQVFARYFDYGQTKGIALDDWNLLLAGPQDRTSENDFNYFDVWAEILNTIEITIDGVKYLVAEQDGIWIYPESIHDEINWDEFY